MKSGRSGSLLGVLTVVLFLLCACATPEQKAAKAQARADERAAKLADEGKAIHAAIPADSPLQKVQLGMAENEVTALLGDPSFIDAHPTGKAFNPFNFGGKDTVRTVYHFKGIGRVEFSSGSWGQRNGVITMVHDSEEPGSRRPN